MTSTTATHFGGEEPHATTAGRLLLASIVVGFYALAVYHGIQWALVPAGGLSELLVSQVFWIAVCAWALTDARQRNHPVPYSLRIWYLVLAPIVVPGYVWRTRGWRGLLGMVLVVVSWNILAVATWYLLGFAGLGGIQQ